MRRLNLLAALLLTGAAGACAPNPIIARDPVPAPGPEVGYVCDSRPLVLNAFDTKCTPVAREPQVVLRSKG
ncbi:hypothetical protein [Methylobacterium oxalidis]|uniref:Lipoprotein n=1 Tax=Methylobacterium oxalidis TaxID=944322 RepID=A0A512J509_9HYPH|nr:hypothetical protein [Methylobacterium oxalidis]GEP05048.1 hypothetical protein MOX02_30860 [Methylobacterium oxalidis]GJE33354.1 hypothetical protein LDDCCGHA_3554 [Methylobacterium oxalidis]GLS65673.1 hypothetical protein GCM10007888_40550 [Methylobacterium oxalidis]